MFARPLSMALLLVSAALPAAAQRTDILTGEPVRPPSAHPRAEPEIFNAPHAPRQQTNRAEDTPPMEIYIAPQIGGGTGYPVSGGVAGQGSGSQYPGRLSQGRRY